MALAAREHRFAFLRFVGAYALALAAVSYFPLSLMVSPEALRSFVAAALLSLLHVLFGYATIEYSSTKKSTTIIKFVLGGMVIRLVLMASLLLVLLKYYEYDPFSLMMSMLVLYVVNLALEIAFLQQKVSLKNNG